MVAALICSHYQSACAQTAVRQHQIMPRNSKTVRMLSVGDILLAGPMEKLMSTKGMDFPFKAMSPLFKKSDLVFANLECCISDCGEPVPKKYNFRARPERAEVLSRSGISIVSMANNHAWDFGRAALLQTKQLVEKSGVITVGAGANRTEAHSLRIVLRRGIRIGFLAYLGLFPAVVPESDTEPCLAMGDFESVRREVSAARKLVDVLIVSLHCGIENAPKPSPHQIALAHSMIDSGADLVVGHHPHVIQRTEVYHGKTICYSLGNFAFSTTGRGSGQMLEATMSRGTPVQVKLIRLDLSGGQPHIPRFNQK